MLAKVLIFFCWFEFHRMTFSVYFNLSAAEEVEEEMDAVSSEGGSEDEREELDDAREERHSTDDEEEEEEEEEEDDEEEDRASSLSVHPEEDIEATPSKWVKQKLFVMQRYVRYISNVFVTWTELNFKIFDICLFLF